VSVTGAIDASGSDGDDSGDTTDRSGGTGGDVMITAADGTIGVVAITTDGGAVDIDATDDGDVVTGGNAGTITLAVTETEGTGRDITIAGILSAQGGASEADNVAGNGNAVDVSITDAGGVAGDGSITLTAVGGINTSGGNTDGTAGATAGNASTIDLVSEANAGVTVGSITVTAGANITATSGTFAGGGIAGTAETITLNSAVDFNLGAGGSTVTGQMIDIDAGRDVDIDGAIATVDITTTGTAGADAATSGDIDILAAGDITGSGSLTTGDATVDDTVDGGADTATVGSIDLEGLSITGAAATTGLIVGLGTADTQTDGDTNDVLNTGAVNVKSTGTAGAGDANIYIQSAADLVVGTLETTDAQADTVDIRTTGNMNLLVLGGYTTVAEDTFVFDAHSAGATGDLTFSTNDLTADSITANASGTLTLNVDLTGTTTLTGTNTTIVVDAEDGGDIGDASVANLAAGGATADVTINTGAADDTVTVNNGGTDLVDDGISTTDLDITGLNTLTINTEGGDDTVSVETEGVALSGADLVLNGGETGETAGDTYNEDISGQDQDDDYTCSHVDCGAGPTITYSGAGANDPTLTAPTFEITGVTDTADNITTSITVTDSSTVGTDSAFSLSRTGDDVTFSGSNGVSVVVDVTAGVVSSDIDLLSITGSATRDDSLTVTYANNLDAGFEGGATFSFDGAGNPNVNDAGGGTGDSVTIADSADATGRTIAIDGTTVDIGLTALAYSNLENLRVETGTGNDGITMTGGPTHDIKFIDADGGDADTFVLNTAALSVDGDVVFQNIETIDLDESVTAATFTATTGIDVFNSDTFTITTDGLAGFNNDDAGAIQITTTGALTTGALSAVGGTATGAGNDGGAVTLDAGAALTINGTIDSSGSDAAGASGLDGGDAGGIDLDGTITLTDDLTAAGGAGDGAGNQGDGGLVRFRDAVTLNKTGGTITIDSRGNTGGGVMFDGTLNATITDDEKLTASGGDITFTGVVGGANAVGDVILSDSTMVDVDAAFSATSLTATSNITVFDSTGVLITTTNDADVSTVDDTTVENITSTAGDINLRVDVNDTAASTLTLIGTLDAANVNLTGGTAGGDDTLITQDAVNTWVITGADTGTLANPNITTAASATYTNLQNLTGSVTNNDTFTFNLAGTSTGTINGQGQTGGNGDVLDFSAKTAAQAISVTAAGANGFAGTSTSASNFSNIDSIVGGSGTDTLTGNIAAGGAFTVQAGDDTYVSGGNTLLFSAIENLTGGAGVDIFNINQAHSGNINAGAGDDTLNLNSVVTGGVTGGAGSNVLNSTAQINGTYTATGNDTWNHTAGVRLATTVTGAGSLTIPDNAGGSLVIGAGDLVLPNLTGFSGHTVIGGTLTPGGVDPFYTATAITFNTVSLTVTDAISSGGSVTLLAGDIFLNNDITVTNADSIIGMVAAGPAAVPGSTTGVIDASAGPVTLTAPASTNNPSAALVAEDTIVSSENITLNFGGDGEIDVAVGSDDELEFNGASQNVDNTTDPDFEAFTIGTLAAAGLSVGVTTTFSINPASSLIGLEVLAFIDVGLFEEELTLYGQIGTGIALALAQCEEQEGCAPNVTEDELNNLIESLEARLLELERRLAEEADSNVRAELEELIDGFNDELQDFRGYRQELQDFFSAEEEDEFEEELDEDLPDEEGLLGEQPDVGEVARLAKVLETVKARIEWLESLKVNTEERARLSKSTGIELTQETLDTIIEAARSEAAFIENQIKLLIEGTEAMLSPAPVFTAEARDYDSMQTIHYGSDYLNGLPTKSLLNIN
jgi:hypothetical protein